MPLMQHLHIYANICFSQSYKRYTKLTVLFKLRMLIPKLYYMHTLLYIYTLQMYYQRNYAYINIGILIYTNINIIVCKNINKYRNVFSGYTHGSRILVPLLGLNMASAGEIRSKHQTTRGNSHKYVFLNLKIFGNVTSWTNRPPTYCSLQCPHDSSLIMI